MIIVLFIMNAELLARQYDGVPAVRQTHAPVLVALANNTEKPGWVRARAVQLLALVDVPSLDALANDSVLRRAKVRAWSRVYKTDPARAEERIAPYLQDADASVRKLAVAALPRALLLARLTNEDDASVRDAIVDTLSKR